MEGSRLESFKDFDAQFATCRNPNKGKPVGKNYRIFKIGASTYALHFRGYNNDWIRICRINRQDRVTFEFPLSRIPQYNGLVGSLHRYIPFIIGRISSGMYRVESTVVLTRIREDAILSAPYAKWSRWDAMWGHLGKKAPQYFTGIAFNAVTGECFNGQPDLQKQTIPEIRSAWLKDLRRYKRGLLTRVRIGAMRGYLDAEAEIRKKGPQQYPWEMTWDKIAPLLIKSMKKEEYPKEILQAFIRVIPWVRLGASVTEKELTQTIHNVFRQNSMLFRQKYGVFGKTLHKKT